MPLVLSATEKLTFDDSLSEALSKTLSDNPPLQMSEGGVIRDGFNEEVDHLRRISVETEEWLKDFEIQERKRTGIN